jgi:hypothetical protein
MSASYFDEVSPKIFECDLDRDQAGIPPAYMLNVSGVLLAGRDMLIAIGMAPGAPEPDGWQPAVPAIPDDACFPLCRTADFEKPSRDGNRVLRAKRFGKFWSAERSTKITSGRYKLRLIETLVFAFGNGEIPIWTRTHQAAMRLAEHCDPTPASPVAGFWLPMFTCT